MKTIRLFFLNVLNESRALSVVWTTPLVATLGMSLTIPLAMLADMVIHGRHYSAIYILGCIQVESFFFPSQYLAYYIHNQEMETSLTDRVVNWIQVFAGFIIANLSDKFSAKGEL